MVRDYRLRALEEGLDQRGDRHHQPSQQNFLLRRSLRHDVERRRRLQRRSTVPILADAVPRPHQQPRRRLAQQYMNQDLSRRHEI